jgi:hypothetical protein
MRLLLFNSIAEFLSLSLTLRWSNILGLLSLFVLLLRAKAIWWPFALRFEDELVVALDESWSVRVVVSELHARPKETRRIISSGEMP